MQKRREKGLCFSCNERFTPSHRCAVKQLFIFDVETGDGEDLPGENLAPEEDDAYAEEVEPHISLHALAGYTGPRTMRVLGRIGYWKVLILIDSGSTHNFIDQKVAHHLGLSVTPITEFWVTVANGQQLSCTEKHEGVEILIQGLEITATFFSLPLNGLDVVLGIQWLEKLGPVVCDWGRLSMTFTRGEKVYEIVAQCRQQGRAISNTMMGRDSC
jgi:predicted aspartyl protease